MSNFPSLQGVIALATTWQQPVRGTVLNSTSGQDSGE